MSDQTEAAREIPLCGASSKEVIVVEEASEILATDDAEPPQKKRRLTKAERYIRAKELRRAKRKKMKMRKRARRDEGAGEGTRRSQLPLQKVSMAESTCKTCVVLDCAYDHLMSFKDICKLAHQLSQCYSTNRHLPAPVQLYITGLGSALKTVGGDNSPTGSCEPHEQSTLARLYKIDCQNWDVFLKMEAYTDLFPASSIVYLCAESPYELPDAFEPASREVVTVKDGADTSSVNNCSLTEPTTPVFTTEDVYVIGGFVDHNHHQGFCYQQEALQRGHRTARLPLDRAGVAVEGRRVLASVHVFQALAFVLSAAHPKWSDALRAALPPRKCGL